MKKEDLNSNKFPEEIKTDNENLNPLLDIISSIQEKLDTSNQTNNTYNNQNINYSNSNNKISHESGPQNSSFDSSKLFELLNNLNSTNTSSQKNHNSSSNPFTNLDMDTMMRLGKIFSGMNREDPRKNLLLSLKPFLRDNRQKNVDTYIFILGILNALDAFNSEGNSF